jgi:hypothetical protein
MREIHDIRLEIQEETKNMTPEQEMEYYSAATRRVEEQRGIKFRRPESVPARKVM